MGMAKFTMSIPEAMRKAGGRDEAKCPRPGDQSARKTAAQKPFRLAKIIRRLRATPRSSLHGDVQSELLKNKTGYPRDIIEKHEIYEFYQSYNGGEKDSRNTQRKTFDYSRSSWEFSRRPICYS